MELQRVSHSDWFPRIRLMGREYRQIWTKIKKTFWTKTNYLVWGRGDSSLIENKSFEAVEPWLGAAAGVDQLAAAPKLILFEGTDDFFGFSCATLKIKTRFSKIWMDSIRDPRSIGPNGDPWIPGTNKNSTYGGSKIELTFGFGSALTWIGFSDFLKESKLAQSASSLPTPLAPPWCPPPTAFSSSEWTSRTLKAS